MLGKHSHRENEANIGDEFPIFIPSMSIFDKISRCLFFVVLGGGGRLSFRLNAHLKMCFRMMIEEMHSFQISAHALPYWCLGKSGNLQWQRAGAGLGQGWGTWAR